MFLALTGEFENVQGLCNFRKLEASGVTLDAFKGLARLLTRGDLICM
jgi:lysyl-tRNA synthetase class 2